MPRTPPGSRCVISREKRTRTLWMVYVELCPPVFGWSASVRSGTGAGTVAGGEDILRGEDEERGGRHRAW